MKKITFLFTFLLSFFAFGQSVATYNISFTNYWNITDHNNGNPFPGNPHWTDLVGVNHNSNVTFLEMGSTATTGVENIAEQGNQGVFQTVDVQNAIDANNAQQFFDAGDLFLSTPSNTIVYNGLEVNEDYPLLTMLSMIAPSPDWMIAVNGLNLRESNNWKSSITIDLFPYDAGTEEGSTYSLSNAATNLQGVITNISGVPPFNTEKVAELTISLESVLNVNHTSFLEKVKLYPNPTNGNITISNIQNIELKTIEFYSVLGKLVKQIEVKQNPSKLSLDLSQFNKGMYLLKVLDANGASHTQKLVIE